MSSMNREEEIILSLISQFARLTPHVVDIGAGDGITFSNSHALITSHKWHATLIEGKREVMASLADLYADSQRSVSIVNTYVSPLDIASLLRGLSVPQQFGVLSLDIDSFEYDLLDSLLKEYRPSILCVEINERFPPHIDYRLVWEPGKAYPDLTLVSSASISCMCTMLESHGYVGIHLEYNNLIAVPIESPGQIQAPIRAAMSPSDLYYRGYWFREDRAAKFPWNARFEHWQVSDVDQLRVALGQLSSGSAFKFFLDRRSHL